MVKESRFLSPNQATMYIINEDKLIEIFVDCDDFCQLFNPIYEKRLLGKPKRRPILIESEVLTILIMYHLSGMKCFKYYYNRMVQTCLKNHFPNLVSYNRFIELIPRHMMHLWIFLNSVRMGEQMGISYIDSKKLTVCHNRRIYQHKVFKNLATRGHCSVGWFFGFKLFLAINPVGQVLKCFVTPGNAADDNADIMRKLINDLRGKVFGDKGFINAKISEEFAEKGVHLITKVRKNMKNKLISLWDKRLLLKRGVVESVFDIMSAICDIDHSRHRSPANAFTHLFAGIIAYTYLDKLPSIFRTKFQLM